ncbi:MAG TPA: hypothetical protein VMW52_00875, partial [Phycisphaerae bacterium]|nr:hypothetical protein [Phycisphaerae bacterium]
MSLTGYIERKEVRESLKRLRPKVSRKILGPIKALPLTDHYSLVGTAFDYLFRFGLQRRVRHAQAGAWV